MKISIIIPPLFSIASLKNILESISKQSYSHYEVIIIVESGMEPGHLTDSFQNISSRIMIIQNTGESLNSISQAFFQSSGDLIWILDCVDDFDAEKLNLHVELFNANPAIGGIRSGFVRKEADNECYSLSTVGSAMDVADFFLDGPVYFSDVIFRREWIEKFFIHESPQEACSTSSLSLHFYVQTLVAGCRIVGLNQVINVRHKANEENLDIKKAVESAIRSLDHLFANPYIESSIAKWKDKATAQAYLYWSIKAFGNEETELGQRLFRSSILLNRSILDIGAQGYFSTLIKYARQEGEAIDKFIGKIIDQLSPEFAWMSQYSNEAIARGYFYKAVDEIAFGRLDCASQSMSQANAYGINLTELDSIEAIRILSDHEAVYGFDAVKQAVKDLAQLGKFVDRKKINWIQSTWFINQAFAKYIKNEYEAVPQKVIDALLISPGSVSNPGVGTIFFKSLFQIIKSNT